MIGVAIQGGAMRSIYCVGVIRALSQTNAVASVSTINVASAGCVSGAILASLVGKDGDVDVSYVTERLLRALAGRRFIDSRRLSGVVDVDYLVETLLDTTGLRITDLNQKSLRFEVALTDAKSGQATYVNLSQLDRLDDLRAALVATMAIPILYRRPAFVEGKRMLDGGIADPLPLMRSLRNPALTKVIAVSSVARGTLADEVTGKERKILKVAPGLSPMVRTLMLTRNPLADATESILDDGSLAHVQLIRVSPSRPELLASRTEVDLDKLLQLEKLGYEDGVAAFEHADL